jgi:hypothetical protein
MKFKQSEITILILLIVIIVGGYLLMNDKDAIETSDWNTYQYNEYGFQVSYPVDWVAEISKDREVGALGFSSPKSDEGNYSLFYIQRYDLDDGGFGYPPETLTAPNTQVDGVKAYKEDGHVRNPDGPSTQGVWLVKDNFVYVLMFNVYKEYNLPSEYKYEDIKPSIFTQEEDALRNAFISSFTFIE